MKLLKQLYKIHSLSGKEKQIKNFIKDYIATNISHVRIMEDKKGNLFITKGDAETYPCVVAHLDQVQKKHSRDFRAIETRDIIFGYSPSKRRQEGLGADDKNGIWIALKCLGKYDAMKVAFFVSEEVGCVGSNAADLTFFEDCRFVIEPDRRSFNDLITQISWENLCSDEFLTDIHPELFGYKPEEGLMTDVEILRGNGLALSCINVSCGYYEPHTDQEFTVKDDLWNCLNFVQHIIENCTKVYHHEVEVYEGFGHYGTYSGYCEYYEDMLLEIMTTHPDYTADDAWEVYFTNFDELSRDEFITMYEECRDIYGIEALEPEKSYKQKVSNPKKISKKKKGTSSHALSLSFFSSKKDTGKRVQ